MHLCSADKGNNILGDSITPNGRPYSSFPLSFWERPIEENDTEGRIAHLLFSGSMRGHTASIPTSEYLSLPYHVRFFFRAFFCFSLASALSTSAFGAAITERKRRSRLLNWFFLSHLAFNSSVGSGIGFCFIQAPFRLGICAA